MNSTLKAAGHIGAELGAAKAENDRLREVLSRIANLPMYQCSTENDYRLSAAKAMAVGALTHQADPTETTEAYTARDMATSAAQGFRDGRAAMETAPAQDERLSIQCPPSHPADSYKTGTHVVHASLVHGLIRQHDRIVAELTRPAQTEQQPEYPHDSMDAIALARYHVVPSGSSTLHRYAVRAGDGECELYRGSKSDCEHVARKLAGAFLDGGLTADEFHAAPIAQTVPRCQCCGYLVTDSEHRGCLRAATPAMDDQQ